LGLRRRLFEMLEGAGRSQATRTGTLASILKSPRGHVLPNGTPPAMIYGTIAGLMSWVRSIGVALLTSIATLFGAGAVAALAVDWYNISSFEGGSGFFVVGMALLGGFAGFLVGLVVSRVVARKKGHRPFLKSLSASCGGVAATF